MPGLTASSPPRRQAPLQMWTRALERVARLADDRLLTFPRLIDRLADQYDTAPALLADGETWSYRALAQRCNRYAHWALAEGLKKGDVAALLMGNCPDYLAIWFGLTRVGISVALVNTGLAGSALAHSLNAVRPSHVIVADALVEALRRALPHCVSPPRCWSFGPNRCGWPRIDEAVCSLPEEAPAVADAAMPSLADRALYIYTSGTTGLPKAAAVSHFRVMQWCQWFAGLMDIGPGDRMYNCLPMYHSIGGVVAAGAVLAAGGGVVIRPRFSASRFWTEIVAWDCTLFQYIGELCRYLVNTPPQPQETAHRLRLCCGNGLRAEIWRRFQSRFRIPQILEYYAATEANFSLFNCEGEPGAVGRIPPFLRHRFRVALIALDLASGEPIRGDDGFCVRCRPGEAGEAIGEIRDDEAHRASRFEGYSDAEATGRKILRDVFIGGDAWYRSGDLMRQDARGHFYFVDRLGDTFRWKGENVSTTEVAEAAGRCPGVLEATVYGVAVPGAEGRAGMATLTVAPGFDLARFHRHLAQSLPEYALPVFVRIAPAIEATGTFKPDKQKLAREGYDPAGIADPVFFHDRGRAGYVPFDADLFARLQRGDLRL